jgi:hypothetical protein
MDRVEKYRAIARQIVELYASWKQRSLIPFTIITRL